MDKKIKILGAAGTPQEMVERLEREIGPVEVLSSHSEEEIIKAIQDKQVFVVRSKPKVTARIIQSAPQLKVIARPGVGIDNIDRKACEERGIKVINTPEASASSVAELTIGLAITLLHYIYPTCHSLKEGKWLKEEYTGKTIEGKTWGIIGFGGIGRRVAEIVKVLRAEVLAYDPYVPDEEFTKRGVKRIPQLEELLEQSDIVSIHVVLNQETEGMFSEELLHKMKKGAYLINTSRKSYKPESLRKSAGRRISGRSSIRRLRSGAPYGPGTPLSSQFDLHPSYWRKHRGSFFECHRNSGEKN
ncbi:MAG TPA: NAD(P)-dependent oxidoreductase [Candidatus Atribacteria bacterium]|nr:NAD(P)-dependent oxidoreductase [Candidatus Atribacteria bacterium]